MNEQQLPAPGPLKRINLETGVFQANGTTYRIESQLSIERYCELQILEKEMAFGTTFRGFFDILRGVYMDLNKADFVSASVKVHNVLQGVAKIEEREPVVLKMCSLFINADGENRAEWSNDLVVKKIQDWKAEGLDMQDFFVVALNSVNGFLRIFSQITEAISKGNFLEAIQEPNPAN